MGTGGDGLLCVRFSSDKRTLSITPFRHDCHHPASLPSDYVYSIHEDLQTRSLWIGTREGIGIMSLTHEGMFANPEETGLKQRLPVREVNTVLRDRSGRMWIATKGQGVFRVDTRNRPFRVIAPREGVQPTTDLISTLYIEKEGALWMGSGYGVDYIKEERHLNLLSGERPYSITYSRMTDEVWIAVHDGGVVACRNGKILHRYRRATCGFIPHDLVYQLHEDRRGNRWACTYKGLGVRYHDGREVCFHRLPGVDEWLTKEIVCMTEESDGSLWLLTNNDGVVHLTGNVEQPDSIRCRHYGREEGGLPVDAPLCLLIDRSGRVWAGTEGSGLCLYDVENDCFRSVHREYGLPGDMVGSMEEDDAGHLWLGTNRGLARLSTRGKEKGEVRIFTVADGLADNFFNRNASFRRDGLLYFGCSRGVVMFRPEVVEKEQRTTFPVVITDIRIDGKPLEKMPAEERKRISRLAPGFTERLVLPAAYRSFSVRFALLTYHQPGRNNYAYRLQGLDTDWHYVDADGRTAYYSKLPPGEYLLELKATGGQGDWSEVRSMKVIVEPPFYATWQARCLYALLLAGMLAFVWWETRRRLMWRNRKHLQAGETDKVNHLRLQLYAAITSDDEKFLQDAIACVNRHLDDPTFDVPQFVDEMATSRTTLHKKLKSLTGQSTTAFIRSIRLKAARQLLDEKKNLRISELAYRVGFNDPRYFSACFKKEFGMQPTEYATKG